MRLRTVATVVVLLGLFGASVYMGYIVGGSFMAPKQRAPASTMPPPKVRGVEPGRAPVVPSSPPQPAVIPEAQSVPPLTPRKQEARLYRVQVGAFLRRENAEAMAERLRKDGYRPYISPSPPYKVQVGAFKEKANAERLAEELRAKGYEVYIAQ
ncbi:MAG: SPOR domain-containing protein [Armatimonadota bacterium]|nr:SPOR domain-containing protein [Armatimonadota bacterium]MDR5703156.1 SPOR domain-containing protein [Armatimonadota bacterium]